jgi:hypothetical protein
MHRNSLATEAGASEGSGVRQSVYKRLEQLERMHAATRQAKDAWILALDGVSVPLMANVRERTQAIGS